MAWYGLARPRLAVLAYAAAMFVTVSAVAVAVAQANQAPEPTSGPGCLPSPSHSHPPSAAPSVAPGAPADRVLQGDQSFPNGFTVPAGQVWEFAPDSSATVTSGANVVVQGVLRMRPANPAVVHTLRFTGIDERRVVGGGMQVLATDVGLWVMGAGQLDFAGSPKAGWNRTGKDAGWRAGDDIRVAPQGKGDFTNFAPFQPGSPVPAVSHAGKSYPTEVLNLTRNVRVQGTGDGGPNPASNGRAHIFINSSKPQSIRYAEISHMGPRRAKSRGTSEILGRYGLHFHMMGDGARGSLVEGVVVRDTGNHAFVPHASHGITFRDTIAYNLNDDAYWWDADGKEPNDGYVNSSHDIRLEHAMAALLRADPDWEGYRLTGFNLRDGMRNTVTDSVAVGVGGMVDSSGFHWPETHNGRIKTNIWTFTNNLAHNNRVDGIKAWFVDGLPHEIKGFVGYRNGEYGVDHGSYLNNFRYDTLAVFDNGQGGILHRSGGSGGPQEFRGFDTDTITFAEKTLDGQLVLFRDGILRDKVIVDETRTIPEAKTIYEFRNVRKADGRELTRADFTVLRQVSKITVFLSNGTSFTV